MPGIERTTAFDNELEAFYLVTLCSRVGRLLSPLRSVFVGVRETWQESSRGGQGGRARVPRSPVHVSILKTIKMPFRRILCRNGIPWCPMSVCVDQALKVSTSSDECSPGMPVCTIFMRVPHALYMTFRGVHGR